MERNLGSVYNMTIYTVKIVTDTFQFLFYKSYRMVHVYNRMAVCDVQWKHSRKCRAFKKEEKHLVSEQIAIKKMKKPDITLESKSQIGCWWMGGGEGGGC